MKKYADKLRDIRQSETELEICIADGAMIDKKNILADMQQTAIDMGTELENCGSEHIAVISMLEEYCELIWQCSEAQTAESARPIFSKMQEKMRRIKENLEAIDRQIEVVFFPYKAAMWDSLESIWRAACKNSKCSVYVVPVPYYEKDNAGRFYKECYEGDLFPKYVPVTGWEDYDIKRRKPGIVFIHNPYDNGNYVTSIHPGFYAKELKKYTELLVYVPYFVFGENIYSGFCIYPGTIYADKIIVQSETVRQTYIREYKEFVYRYKLQQLFPETKIEERFQALGSPKIDKIVNYDRGDYALPDEWREKIGNKKVVLYNTSVSGLLNSSERVLRKIYDVIQCFRENKRVVLWWRPHPLSEETCAALRIDLLENYRKIVGYFKSEAIGIFDDTADLHRAISWADMYYGDESSLVYLFGVKGKPLMLQNPYVLKYDKACRDDRTLSFCDFAYEEGKVWFCSSDHNGLFQMDVTTRETEFLGEIPGEERMIRNLYGKIYKVGDELWMVPYRACGLAKYNIKSRDFEKFDIPGENQKYQMAFLSENHLYMISEEYNRMTVFYLADKTCARVYKWELPAQENAVRPACRMDVFPNVCKVKNALYLVIYGTNSLIKYNLEEKREEIIRIGAAGNKYSNLDYDGKYFWLISHLSPDVIRWEPETNETRSQKICPEGFTHYQWYRTVCCQDGNVWLFPEKGNMICKIDSQSMEVEPVFICGEDFGFWAARGIGWNEIMFTHRKDNTNHTLVTMNTETRQCYEMRVNSPDNFKNRDVSLFSALNKAAYQTPKEYIFRESNNVTIDMAIEKLSNERVITQSQIDCFSKLYCNADGQAGQKIMDMAVEWSGLNG